jgi:hypothetical protein
VPACGNPQANGLTVGRLGLGLRGSSAADPARCRVMLARRTELGRIGASMAAVRAATVGRLVANFMRAAGFVLLFLLPLGVAGYAVIA